MWGGWAASRRARKGAGCAYAIAFCSLVVCSSSGGGGGGFSDEGDVAVDLVPAFAGLTFSQPVKLVQHPTDDDRWYVAEQGGEIHRFLASDPLNTDAVAVDVDDFVGNLGGGGEQGLLGLAFDPDFTTSGEAYLAYTDEGMQASVLARYQSMDGGMTFAPSADPVVLAIPHPSSNHNAGDIEFGVDDFLYYSMGDGGGGNDPNDNGQDNTTLLGSVMRLDVQSMPLAGRDYAIPTGNPFEGNPFCDSGASPTMAPCPEIWAYGLRNPWRMGFDSVTGDLWLGDVGQGALEEVDRILIGRNYGWDCREGDIPHATAALCGGPFEEPEAVYDNPPAGSAAVSGGLVYRGSAIPGLGGHYLYADFYSGEIWGLDTASMDPPELLIDSGFNVASFAEDENGEVYVVTFDSPSIHRLVPAPTP